MEVSSSRHKDNSGQSNLRYKLSIIASWFLQFMLKTEEDFHCGEKNIQQLSTKNWLWYFKFRAIFVSDGFNDSGQG